MYFCRLISYCLFLLIYLSVKKDTCVKAMEWTYIEEHNLSVLPFKDQSEFTKRIFVLFNTRASLIKFSEGF